VLKSLRRPTLDDVALGQYKARLDKNGEMIDPGYLDDPDVPANSLAPTFAAMALYVDNARWAFLLRLEQFHHFASVGESMESRQNV
jgi:glucose-6-phosphate 1-dehydrogenase